MNKKLNLLQLLRSSLSVVILAAITFCFLITILFPVFGSIYRSWLTEEYSHGFFIPPIALLFGWHRLNEARPLLGSSWKGLIAFILGICLMAAGQLAAFEPLQQYGLVITLCGLIAASFGMEVFLALSPAFIYLMFAIPLPRLIYVTLSQDFQLWSSALGVWFIRIFHIPVFQDGNIIDLGTSKLQVVEACSGLRYMFPLMSFGYLVAWLINDKWWKKIVIFLSTIPITIIINALRVAVVGITVHRWGPSMAEGVLHSFEGWMLFLVCLILLGVEAKLLLRIGSGGSFRFNYIALPKKIATRGNNYISGPQFGVFLATLILVFVTQTGAISERNEIVQIHPPFNSFPLKIAQWQGAALNLDKQVLDALNVSDYWIADYKLATGSMPVNLYLAYYASQRIGSSAHSPANCIPGSGWIIEARDTHKVMLSDGNSIELTKLLIKKSSDVQVVYYWFDERGRILNEQYSAKFFLFLDSLLLHRTDGALVRLTTGIAPGESESDAEKRLDAFTLAAMQQIQSYIPGK